MIAQSNVIKKSRKDLAISLFGIVLCMFAVQVLLLGAKRIVFHFYEETMFARSMVTMVSMLFVLAIFSLFWKARKTELNLFPKEFGKIYIVATVAAVLFFSITLFWVKEFTLQNLLMVVYAGIVTPAFEELLFRGFIWNRFSFHIKKEWKVFLIVTVLFGLWHIGYAVGIHLWQGGNLLHCIIMKVLWGTMYGLFLGVIRLKTKNCYLGILAHGILNVFG